MPFFFPLYIPALPRATADYTKPHAYTFQRCHVLLQITRSPTLLFFALFLWLFLSYTRDFISLCVTDSHLPQSVFPGEFPRRKLNYLLVRRLAVKIEFTGVPPGPPKLFLVAFLLLLPLCSKSTTGADSIPCSGFPIQKQAIPAIFHRARITCPLFSYTEYIASLNFCLLLAYVIARYSASLASRILTSRPTYAEKLQGYKNLSPRSNTLPLAGHANTSFLTFAVPKKT